MLEPAEHPAETRRRTAWVCATIFLLGLGAFLIGLDVPNHQYFDEIHYVPAAKQMLAASEPARPTLNREHPPLGKELIAVGIALCGDNALGWRLMSAIFGAGTLVAVYLWALALFDDPAPARFTVAVTLADQFLYVSARIATLDVFMATFTLCGLAAFTASWKPGAPVRRLMLATGACFALATACKWSGLFAVSLWLATIVVVAMLRHWRAGFDEPRETDWFRRDLWASMRWRDWVLCILVVPPVIYAATFLPITGLSLPSFLNMQIEMWRDQATLVTATHPYASAWPTWPILARPIWFLFEPAPAQTDRFMAVVFLGNPVVCWGGIPALIACGLHFVHRRRRDSFLICGAYAALWLTWVVVPRGPGFLYYYLPAGLVVSPAIASFFYNTALARYPVARWLYLALVFASFVHFLPISSAALGVALADYDNLMWFASWR